ncbi:hypothetical protein H6F89_16355 [Cyanobacteria bacterium FACHB-63]|nr:hypothetical protein [Cyanobacteria bacterium FACHB-63]
MPGKVCGSLADAGYCLLFRALFYQNSGWRSAIGIAHKPDGWTLTQFESVELRSPLTLENSIQWLLQQQRGGLEPRLSRKLPRWNFASLGQKVM